MEKPVGSLSKTRVKGHDFLAEWFHKIQDMGSKTQNTGKYALITGATSGFGYEFAKLFAREGYHLVVVARNEEKLRELSADISQSFMVEVLPINKDLFKVTAAEEIYADLQSKGITIDVLVNDAGQGE